MAPFYYHNAGAMRLKIFCSYGAFFWILFQWTGWGRGNWRYCYHTVGALRLCLFI